MLQNNLELIVQFPDNVGYRCRGFRGLRLLSPVYVVFDGANVSNQSVANLLGNAFCQEVLRYMGVSEEVNMPCKGLRKKISCHAMNEITCKKILVCPNETGGTSSIGGFPAPTADVEWLSHMADSTWEVIPTMPSGSPITPNLPAVWHGINVCFWKRHPSEVIWAVMQRAGLVPEESRLFISYVRRDSSVVADQLFEALTQEGFDVFLDRCSVPIGVQFQERLMQDLCDKAMVVLLNTEGVANSYWVGEEIAIIKSYRLGLLELRFPNGKERPDIDQDFTQQLSSVDFLSATPGSIGQQKLSATTLANVVDRIKEVHGRALHRRRYELIDNFAAALMKEGKTAQFLSDETFLLPSNGVRPETVVGLTPRPPELGDFCSLHQRGNVSANRAGWLISPSPFFLAQRQAHVSWLGDISNIQHINEAQITNLVASL